MQANIFEHATTRIVFVLSHSHFNRVIINRFANVCHNFEIAQGPNMPDTSLRCGLVLNLHGKAFYGMVLFTTNM